MVKRKLIPLVLAMVAGTSMAYAAPQYDHRHRDAA